MINSVGYLNKTLWKYSLVFIVFLFTFFNLAQYSDAQVQELDISSTGTFEVEENGNLNGEVIYILRNNSQTPAIIRQFVAKLPFEDVTSVIATTGAKSYTTAESNRDGLTDITIDINDRIVSSGAFLEVKVQFNISSYSDGNTDISDITIPVDIPGTNVRGITYRLPKSFGEIKYVTNNDFKLTENNQNYILQFDKPLSQSVKVSFDVSQVYKVNITKTLENPDDVSIVRDITLPIEYEGQKLYITKITPSPTLAYTDSDQNINAAYKLEAKQNLTVDVEAYVSIESEYTDDNIYEMENVGFWDFGDSREISNFETFLSQNQLDVTSKEEFNALSNVDKDLFYKLVYDYVVNELDINEDYLTEESSYLRQGVDSMTNRDSASVEDYADLLIALYRYYDVPARLKVGYVTNVTERYESEFVHSWVEYRDYNGRWVQLDPVLEDVTEISMYDFSNFDHIAFIKRSENSMSPHISTFAKDEIAISQDFDSIPEFNSSLAVNYEVPNTKISQPNTSLDFTITNEGNRIISDILIDGDLTYGQIVVPKTKVLLPGQSEVFKTKLNIDNEEIESDLPYSSILTLDYSTDDNQNNSINTEVMFEIETFWWWDLFPKVVGTTLFAMLMVILYNFYKKSLEEYVKKAFNIK